MIRFRNIISMKRNISTIIKSGRTKIRIKRKRR